MAEDLDDGELWLPADIIPDVVGLPRSRHVSPLSAGPDHHHSFDHYHYHHLADRLAALAVLDRASNQLHPPNHGHFHHRFAPAAHSGPAHLGRSVAGLANNNYILGGSRPVYHFLHAKPIPVQVEGFGQARSRVLQRPQGGGPDGCYPVRVAGFVREGGGTGVFLPRVVSNDVKKKPSTKGGEQQKQATRNAVVGRQGMSFQPPSEIALPHDWTY